MDDPTEEDELIELLAKPKSELTRKEKSILNKAAWKQNERQCMFTLTKEVME